MPFVCSCKRYFIFIFMSSLCEGTAVLKRPAQQACNCCVLAVMFYPINRFFGLSLSLCLFLFFLIARPLFSYRDPNPWYRSGDALLGGPEKL